jgi:glutamyl-tRNA reductase
LRNSEIDFALRRLADLSPRERRVVEAMSRRLVSKILAPAATFAKESSEKLSQRERLRILSEIFANGGDGQ